MRCPTLPISAITLAFLLSACGELPTQKIADILPQVVTAGAGQPEQPEPADEQVEYIVPEPELLLEDGKEDAVAVETELPDPAVQYNNLWDRIGANLKLPRHMDRREVKGRLAWYAKNQQYLDRVAARGSFYLHHIVSEVEKRGMPLELALLPIVESAFQPRARSPKAAVGIWQFIQGTGKRYGLNQSCVYDGRRDIVAATKAALDYLADLHDEFDDWMLAVAAYNTGERNVARAVRRNRKAGKDTGFFSLRLHRETRGYVPSLLAVAELVANPEQHGIVWQSIPDQQYFAQVDTGGQVDLDVAAELAALTRDELHVLNPGYEDWATRTQDKHKLLLPVNSEKSFLEKLAGLTPAQRLTTTDIGEQCYYIVRRGDTLSHIAQRYPGVTVRKLQAWNGISRPRSLQPGQKLKVFAAPGAQQPEEGPIRYTVKKGDNLSKIAKKFRVTLKDLLAWNSLSKNATIYPKQKITVYQSGSRAVGI